MEQKEFYLFIKVLFICYKCLKVVVSLIQINVLATEPSTGEESMDGKLLLTIKNSNYLLTKI